MVNEFGVSKVNTGEIDLNPYFIADIMIKIEDENNPELNYLAALQISESNPITDKLKKFGDRLDSNRFQIKDSKLLNTNNPNLDSGKDFSEKKQEIFFDESLIFDKKDKENKSEFLYTAAPIIKELAPDYILKKKNHDENENLVVNSENSIIYKKNSKHRFSLEGQFTKSSQFGYDSRNLEGIISNPSDLDLKYQGRNPISGNNYYSRKRF